MTSKEMFLSQLNVFVPQCIMQYDLNLFHRNESTPFAALFTNSKGKVVIRFNPWDSVDGVNFTI